MSKKLTDPKQKPLPTKAETLAKIRPELKDSRFIFHTLCRVISEKTGCTFEQGEAMATALLVSGDVVSGGEVGLTKMQVFKLAEQ